MCVEQKTNFAEIFFKKKEQKINEKNREKNKFSKLRSGVTKERSTMSLEREKEKKKIKRIIERLGDKIKR